MRNDIGDKAFSDYIRRQGRADDVCDHTTDV